MDTSVEEKAGGTPGGSGGLYCKVDTSRSQTDLEAAKEDAEYMRIALKAARKKNRTKLGYGSTHFALQ